MKISDNQLLSRATLISITADFILFFTILKFISTITGSTYFGAYSISVKSAGVGCGSFLLPWFLNRFNSRIILIGSLMIVGTSYLLLLPALKFSPHTAQYFIFTILFIQSFFFQMFAGTREILSKTLGNIEQQRSLQAEILIAFFGGQILGPFFGFFLSKYGNAQITILVCFSLATYSIWKVMQVESTINIKGSNVFRPFGYFKSSPKLLGIFLVRGILHWIPIGIFNYFLFALMEQKFSVANEYSALVYCLIAFGSVIASLTLNENILMKKWPQLRKFMKWFRDKPDYKNASLAYFVLSLTRIAILFVPYMSFTVSIFIISGFANGLNLVSAQSIRRKLCDDTQHAEIIGLEGASAKIVEWTVGSICMVLATSNHLSVNTAVWISSGSLLLLGVLMQKIFDPAINVKTVEVID